MLDFTGDCLLQFYGSSNAVKINIILKMKFKKYALWWNALLIKEVANDVNTNTTVINTHRANPHLTSHYLCIHQWI